ncbi:b3541b67-c426-4612-b85a-2fc19b9435f6 [Sclerotinia trifoliorum]|uniref:B3541b67-c426-4612-b85a-2fc19b9435f6 n=1 Tax=Sclerotinia trifoliorum TaxID=28548 RepID=A0A8H2ZRB9_9HELO|nr:b3541b67-c426-4612-b85a-2fc19b9435f6 [Sclerotinia trifoliorum]
MAMAYEYIESGRYNWFAALVGNRNDMCLFFIICYDLLFLEGEGEDGMKISWKRWTGVINRRKAFKHI